MKHTSPERYGTVFNIDIQVPWAEIESLELKRDTSCIKGSLKRVRE
jgi:hypothetical protein